MTRALLIIVRPLSPAGLGLARMLTDFLCSFRCCTVYVENVLKDDFEPELFPHDVEKSSMDSVQKPPRGYSTEDLKEFVL